MKEGKESRGGGRGGERIEMCLVVLKKGRRKQYISNREEKTIVGTEEIKWGRRETCPLDHSPIFSSIGLFSIVCPQ